MTTIITITLIAFATFLGYMWGYCGCYLKHLGKVEEKRKKKDRELVEGMMALTVTLMEYYRDWNLTAMESLAEYKKYQNRVITAIDINGIEAALSKAVSAPTCNS